MFRRPLTGAQQTLAVLILLLGALSHVHSVQGQSELIFPRLSFEADLISRIALANTTDEDARVTLSAYDSEGALLTGIDNPVSLEIPAYHQVSRLTSELFGSGLDPDTVAWFQARSPVSGLTGSFLYLNSSITLMDGADLPGSARKILFSQVRVDSDYWSEVNIVNPGDEPASVQVELITPDSESLSGSLMIPAKGVRRVEVDEFFDTNKALPGTYLVAESEVPITGFALIHALEGDSLGLNAQDGSEQQAGCGFLWFQPLCVFYVPQMVVLEPWETGLGLVNYSTRPAIVTISALSPNGSLYEGTHLNQNPVILELESAEGRFQDLAEMFGFYGEGTLSGYLKIESTSADITGYLNYEIPVTGSWGSIPATAQTRTRALFSDLATDQGIFMGIALLNPGTLASNVRILAIASTGEVLGSHDTVLQPGQRLSRLVDEVLPEKLDTSGGVIWVKSDLPLNVTSLFGNVASLATTSAQTVSDSYLPDAGLSSFQIKPPLAIVQQNKSQPFFLEAETSQITWKVNGIAGGNRTLGRIDSEGIYTAPEEIPSPQVVTITAEAGNRTTGASVDVLDKNTLFDSERIVQSVTYLGSLEKLYTAELSVLGTEVRAARTLGSEPVGRRNKKTKSPNGVTSSEIFESTADFSKVSIASFNNEKISKMVPFEASNGQEFLLLAGQTTGRIIRLDPVTRETRDVVTGLDEPSALVMDSVSGALLVAEKDRITRIPRLELESGLVSAAVTSPFPGSNRELVTLLSNARGAGGVAVDNCTGNIYISDKIDGRIYEYIRSTDLLQASVTELKQPGQLLAVYRTGVACPYSFQLLVSEQGSDRVAVVVPRKDFVATWFDALDNTDLAFLEAGNSFVSSSEAIVLTEANQSEQVIQASSSGSSIVIVKVPDLYEEEPVTVVESQPSPQQAGKEIGEGNVGGIRVDEDDQDDDRDRGNHGDRVKRDEDDQDQDRGNHGDRVERDDDDGKDKGRHQENHGIRIERNGDQDQDRGDHGDRIERDDDDRDQDRGNHGIRVERDKDDRDQDRGNHGHQKDKDDEDRDRENRGNRGDKDDD